MRGALMEAEIREQVEVLRRGATDYRLPMRQAVEDRRFDLVLLVARGSSDNAALYARYLIEVFCGIPVSLAAPSVLTRYGKAIEYRRCLAVGISQSGAAPDVAEVLDQVRRQGNVTLAITNTPGSRLTQTAEFSLLLNTGPERSVAATKTFTASLLALYQMVRAMGARLPDPLDLMPDENWLEVTRAAAEEASGVVVRSQPVIALGRGFSFSVAHETALKLMECALIPAKAYSSADFEHGPKALAGHGSAAVSFLGPVPHLSEQGCEVIPAPAPLSDDPALEPVFPIWDAFFGQWLALSAARSRALDPDIPRYLKKVTETL